jgi:maltose alpha-D-glucosyltransferase/alpha-amylase
VRGSLPIPVRDSTVHLSLVQVSYAEGDDETYVLPLAFADAAIAERVLPHAIVARLRCASGDGVLCDAFAGPDLARSLLATIVGRRGVKGDVGELAVTTTNAFRGMRRSGDLDIEPRVASGEQSNSSVIYGDRYILKLFRKLEPGPNPDAEIGRFLTERGFPHIAPLAGTLELVDSGGAALVATLTGFVADAEDCWKHTLDQLGRYFERAATADVPMAPPSASTSALLARAEADVTDEPRQTIGTFLDQAELLGHRTAQFHLALASGAGSVFSPEPFSTLYQRSLYQSLRSATVEVLQLLRQNVDRLHDGVAPEARWILDRQRLALDRFDRLLGGRIDAQRIRIHGDYHLGQVLYTSQDFVIIDFEGEPARPLGERRIKRSPLRDVAGMIRSFHYASRALLLGQGASAPIRAEDVSRVEPWARYWYGWVSARFLKGYLDAARPGGFLPSSHAELAVLLDVLLLEKALYELGYELNSRPDWVELPLRGIRELLEDAV